MISNMIGNHFNQNIKFNLNHQQIQFHYIMRFCYSRLYIQLFIVQNQTMELKNDRVVYGYIVSPGNNPTVIENALKKRNVWQSLSPDKDLLSACFLWKQLNYSSKVYDDFEEVLKSYPNRHVLLNHFESNHVITTKSGLLKTLKYYYSHELVLTDRNCHIHDVIPTSFIVHAHKDDTDYKDFIERFHQLQKKNYNKEKVAEKHCQRNVWFIKPQSDNQGKGIILSNNFKEIEAFLVSKPVNSGWVVQKAIQKPLLYYGRKFDIRVWVLVTPYFEVYYYNTPYMRTSSSTYTTQSLNSQIHLTNNCQQKHFTQYSKYQEGNTIPMRETLLAYIETLPNGFGKSQQIVETTIERIKEIIMDTLMSARKYFFGKGTKKKQFELFGYDFLIDQDFKTWLLQVNNNPYLGVPNNFIKELLPQMVDQMLQIVVDPVFPPENYTPIENKRFQIIYKETSIFRISPIRVSSSNDNKYIPRRDKSFSKQKSLAAERPIKSEVYNIGTGKQQKIIKPIYSTPAESIKYLLDNYCYNDFDPFMIPVSLMLNSPSLVDDQLIQTNLKKLKLITETRIANILLEPKISEQALNIIGQDRYCQKIKQHLIMGFKNACKTFKARIHIQKKLLPILCQNIRVYKQNIEQGYLEAIMRLLIATGAYFDRSIFIPGETRQNQFSRQLFVKSNTLKLLLYLKKKYPNICNNQIDSFVQNLSQKDWQLFYESSGNKAKRCYSPKVNTLNNEAQFIAINTQAITDEKPRVLTMRQNAEIKNFRTRRLSGNTTATKKQ